MLAVPLASAT